MPIVSRVAEPITSLATGVLPDMTSLHDDSDTTVLGAAFRQNNLVASGITSWHFTGGINNEVDPNYSAWNEIKGTPYEQHWDAFAASNNSRYTKALMQQIDREEKDKRTLDSSGWAGTFANLGAVVVDPTILIPVGGELAKAGQAYRVLRAGAETAAKSAAAVGVQEVGLQATQSTRPIEESAQNVGFGLVLGGLLGTGAAALLSKAEKKAAQKAFDTILTHDPVSAGAAATSKSLGIENLTVGPGAEGIAKSTQLLSPNLRLNFSPSAVARQLGQELGESSVYQTGHDLGITTGPAIERLAGNAYRSHAARAAKALNSAFKDMKKAGIRMSSDEFLSKVGVASSLNEAENDFILRAANEARSEMQPLFDQAKAIGIFKEGDDVRFADAYFPRQYKRKVMIAGENEIKPKLAAWIEKHIQERYAKAAETFRTKVGELAEKVAAGDEEAIKSQKKLESSFAKKWETKNLGEGVDPHNPDAATPNFGNLSKLIVEDFYQKVTGRDYGSSATIDPDYLTSVARGPIKERTLPVPDRVLHELGILETRADIVWKHYARVMAADIELTRKFGSPRLDNQLKDLADDYAKLREGVTDPKKLLELDKRQRHDQRDIEGLRDLIRGTYKIHENQGAFARIARVAGAFQFITKMGGVVPRSLSDIYRPAMVHGLAPYMSEGIAPIIRNFKAFKMTVNESKLAGIVVERELQHRMMAYSSLRDPLERGTAVERFMENATRLAGKWSGINLWNDFMKSVSSTLSQNRILGGKLPERTLTFLGIDPGTSKAIQEQFAAHGEIIDGVHVANTEQWTDQNAVRAFRAAVGKDVDSMIVTPGVGDTPLFAHTPTGRLLLQFKSYTLSSHQKVVMRGLQENKARFISGMIGMTAIGMLSATISAWRAGASTWDKFKKSAENPGFLISEGLDSSGFFSLPFDIANTQERLGQSAGFSFNPIKTPALAVGSWAEPTSSMEGKTIHYSERGPAEVLGGPTVGTAADIAKATGAGVKKARGKELNKSDVNTVNRIIPFQSYVGMREALQAFEGNSPYMKEQ
jgi:hypothetical protein